jgi:PDZ domain-containing protein
VPDNLYAEGEMPKNRSNKRALAGLSMLLVFTVALITLGFFQAPYVIERPGPVVDVLGAENGVQVISIPKGKVYATSGELDLLTVSVVGNREQTPTWPELFWAWLDPAQTISPLDSVFPAGQTQQESDAESSAMMEQSQQDAIAVAMLKLGYEIPSHVYVSEVSKNKPSSGKLVAGDYVTAVNGTAPKSVDHLREMVNQFDGKNALKISVLRSGKTLSFDITPIKNTDDRWVLGIYVGTKFDFPIEVNLQLSDIGGPSGGTMFAIGIYDRLTPGALLGGQHVAGTGTIDVSGAVGPIGGIRQKLYGAQRAGATYFLAPAENCDEVVGHIPSGLQVFSIKTFDEAISVVDAIGKKQSLSKFATCSTK